MYFDTSQRKKKSPGLTRRLEWKKVYFVISGGGRRCCLLARGGGGGRSQQQKFRNSIAHSSGKKKKKLLPPWEKAGRRRPCRKKHRSSFGGREGPGITSFPVHQKKEESLGRPGKGWRPSKGTNTSPLQKGGIWMFPRTAKDGKTPLLLETPLEKERLFRSGQGRKKRSPCILWERIVPIPVLRMILVKGKRRFGGCDGDQTLPTSGGRERERIFREKRGFDTSIPAGHC